MLVLVAGCRDVELHISTPPLDETISNVNETTAPLRAEIEQESINTLGYGLGYLLGFYDGKEEEREGYSLEEEGVLLNQTVTEWTTAMGEPLMQEGFTDCENGRRVRADQLKELERNEHDYYLGGYWLCLVNIDLNQSVEMINKVTVGYSAGYVDGFEVVKPNRSSELNPFGQGFDIEGSEYRDVRETMEMVSRLAYGLGYYIGYDEGYDDNIFDVYYLDALHQLAPFEGYRDDNDEEYEYEYRPEVVEGLGHCNNLGKMPYYSEFYGDILGNEKISGYVFGYWLCLIGSDMGQFESASALLVTGYLDGLNVGLRDSNVAVRGHSFGLGFDLGGIG